MQSTFSVAVYCSASDRIDPAFRHPAAEVGRQIAEQGWRLVFGAGGVGLMGVVARAAHEAGGRVMGVIPHALDGREQTYEAADELIRVETMRQRKALMEENADAYIALPGGFGTLEEIVEVLVLKQLRYMDRPVVFVDIDGYWQPLMLFFERMIELRFATPAHRNLYRVVDSAAAAIEYIGNYYPEAGEE